MSACRALETPTRVAYLGPAGTFSELAALGFFGSTIVKIPCATFDEVFHVTSAGAADFGVVPIENSSEGVVTRSLDLFLTTPLFIIGETSLYVRHNLLRREKLARAPPRRVRTSAGARAVPWLAEQPPAERRAPPGLEQRRRCAAGESRLRAAGIGKTHAATEFGLHIVAPAIQDDAHNRTRFAVVAHPHRTPAQNLGTRLTSLIVSVTNRPGAVHDILVPLKNHGVSMTRFESRPARSGQWEYYFYIDLQGHPDEPNVGAALNELRTSVRSSSCWAPTLAAGALANPCSINSA